MGHVLQDVVAVRVDLLLLVGLGGGTAKVIAAEDAGVGGRDGLLGMRVPDGGLLEPGGVGEAPGDLLGVVLVEALGGRGTIEEAPGGRGGVADGDPDLGARVIGGDPLQRDGVGQGGGGLLGVRGVFPLGGAGAIEVVPSEALGGRPDGGLGVGEVGGHVPEGARVGEDAEALEEELVVLLVLFILGLAITEGGLIVVAVDNGVFVLGLDEAWFFDENRLLLEI
mmetsp:Transcript_30929/g.92704  ORF Transcript_30929/g.92704 Transcript_30929/m.92704 type:complete len:224 (-) Transcript_30929:523-1194(-)